jgi:hypothetical protein
MKSTHFLYDSTFVVQSWPIALVNDERFLSSKISCCELNFKRCACCRDGCHNLEHLNISWCTKVTDEGLEAVARGCNRLRILICKGCDQLTDTGFHHVADNCSRLAVVNANKCSVSP